MEIEQFADDEESPGQPGFHGPRIDFPQIDPPAVMMASSRNGGR